MRQVDAAIGVDSEVMSTYPALSTEIQGEVVMLAKSLPPRIEDARIDVCEIAQVRQPDEFIESGPIKGLESSRIRAITRHGDLTSDWRGQKGAA